MNSKMKIRRITSIDGGEIVNTKEHPYVDEVVIGDWLHLELMNCDEENDSGDFSYWIKIGDQAFYVGRESGKMFLNPID